MRRTGGLVLMMTAGALGVGLAVLVGIAVAKSFTLDVAKDATVTNFFSPNTHTSVKENIAADGGFAVYMLSGDSKKHPKCTKAVGCFSIWPPVTIPGKKLTKASGVRGKLGTWKRDGFTQVTLAGHPLYFFAAGHDTKGHATGEDIHSFHGVWHVLALAGAAGGRTTSTGTTTGTTTYPSPTGTTTPYPYP